MDGAKPPSQASASASLAILNTVSRLASGRGRLRDSSRPPAVALAEFGPEASTVVDYTTRLFILYRDPGDPVGSLLNGSPVQETGCGTGGGYRPTAHFGPDI